VLRKKEMQPLGKSGAELNASPRQKENFHVIQKQGIFH
jgi:hypothetical protein